MSDVLSGHLADPATCAAGSAILLAFGLWYSAPGYMSLEATVLWSTGTIVGLAGAFAGYAAVRRAKSAISVGVGGFGLAIALGAGTVNAYLLLSRVLG